MKSFFFSIIFITSTIVTEAQSTFRISGSINGLKSGIVKLVYVHQNGTKEFSSEIKNGKFVFYGSLPEPERLTINFNDSHFKGEVIFFCR